MLILQALTVFIFSNRPIIFHSNTDIIHIYYSKYIPTYNWFLLFVLILYEDGSKINETLNFLSLLAAVVQFFESVALP